MVSKSRLAIVFFGGLDIIDWSCRCIITDWVISIEEKERIFYECIEKDLDFNEVDRVFWGSDVWVEIWIKCEFVYLERG